MVKHCSPSVVMARYDCRLCILPCCGALLEATGFLITKPPFDSFAHYLCGLQFISVHRFKEQLDPF